MQIAWKKHRDGIWPLDTANLSSGHQITATQYERRVSPANPFKRVRRWHWSIVNGMGRKLAAGDNAMNRKEARAAAGAAMAKL